MIPWSITWLYFHGPNRPSVPDVAPVGVVPPPSIPADHMIPLSSIRFPPKTKHFSLSFPIFGEGRLNEVREYRSERVSVRKVLSLQALSRPRLAITPLSLSQRGQTSVTAGAGSTPFTEADPSHHTHLQRSCVCFASVPDSRYSTEFFRIHPKMGSSSRSRGQVVQRVSPLTSPFARAKPKVRPASFGSSVWSVGIPNQFWGLGCCDRGKHNFLTSHGTPRPFPSIISGRMPVRSWPTASLTHVSVRTSPLWCRTESLSWLTSSL